MHITIYSDVLLLQKQIHRFSQKKKERKKWIKTIYFIKFGWIG